MRHPHANQPISAHILVSIALNFVLNLKLRCCYCITLPGGATCWETECLWLAYHLGLVYFDVPVYQATILCTTAAQAGWKQHKISGSGARNHESLGRAASRWPVAFKGINIWQLELSNLYREYRLKYGLPWKLDTAADS